MNEQEQQNVVSNEQSFDSTQDKQEVNQMAPIPMSPPPSHKKLIIGIVVAFVLIVAGTAGAYFFFLSQDNGEPIIDSPILNNEGAAKNLQCTSDANICPNGIVVGRISPNCEFAECPTLTNYDFTTLPEVYYMPFTDISKLLRGSIDELGVSFYYPESWGELVYTPQSDNSGGLRSLKPLINFQTFNRRGLAEIKFYFERGQAHAGLGRPYVEYRDEPLDTVCQNNAYFNDFYDFTITECSVRTNSNGVEVATFKVRFAVQYRFWNDDANGYDYDFSRLIPIEERNYKNFKFSLIHTQSEEWRGLISSLYFDKLHVPDLNVKLEIVFDSIIDSISYLD